MSCGGFFCPVCILDMIKYYLRLKPKNGYYFAKNEVKK